MVLVATQVKRRRGTTAENDAFTGAEGEIVVDTERHELRVHDGVTQGGFKIGGDKANVALDNLTNAGTEVIAHNAMPSSRLVNLYTNLPANNTKITAPADGYMCVAVRSGAVGQYISLSTGIESTQVAYTTNETLTVSIPVSKGREVTLFHNITGSMIYFRFVYANGAQ